QVAIIYDVGLSTLYRKFPAASHVKPGGADREDKSPAIIIEIWLPEKVQNNVCIYLCTKKQTYYKNKSITF
ncbi:hypothetical protein ACY3OZ_003432, partial [Salmonella enterica]